MIYALDSTLYRSFLSKKNHPRPKSNGWCENFVEGLMAAAAKARDEGFL